MTLLERSQPDGAAPPPVARSWPASARGQRLLCALAGAGGRATARLRGRGAALACLAGCLEFRVGADVGREDGPVSGEVGVAQVVAVLSHARDVLLDGLPETPPARPCGKLAPHAFRAARNFELFAPPPGKPDGGPPAGGEPEPPAGAPEGGLPAPGVPDGRVTPCWRRQVASAVRLVADPVVAADVEFVYSSCCCWSWCCWSRTRLRRCSRGRCRARAGRGWVC